MAFIDGACGSAYVRTSEFLSLSKLKSELERVEAQARGLQPASAAGMSVKLDSLEHHASAAAALAAALEAVRRLNLKSKTTRVAGPSFPGAQQTAHAAQRTEPVVQQSAPVGDDDAAHMIEALFQRFDVDGDGFHNLKESQELSLFVHDHLLRRGEFLELCDDVEADPKRGISLQHFTTIYTDPEFHADLEGDYKKVFGAKTSARNRSSSAVY